jgi:hypothetical protein
VQPGHGGVHLPGHVKPKTSEVQMPFFRVPFFGSLLVEANSDVWAYIVASQWTVSMRQATHGTEMQPVSPEIKAAEFCIRRSNLRDITTSLQRSMKRDKARAKKNPGGQVLAKMFSSPYVYVGLQAAWQSHEFKRMRPAGNKLPTSRPKRDRTRRKGNKK